MIIQIVILVLAIPIGFLIAWLTKDELSAGDKWFRAVFIISILSAIWFGLVGDFHVTWASGFVAIVTLISIIRARSGEMTKKS